jgi:hypothetical protein
LEEKSPELARFNIAKRKIFVGDAPAKDDIQADCDAGFGPALYLMAANSYWRAQTSKIGGVDRGARSGPPITVGSLRRAQPRRSYAATFLLALPRRSDEQLSRQNPDSKKPPKTSSFQGLVGWLRG